jgi:membrane protein YqaA with SNARE-associated domain
MSPYYLLFLFAISFISNATPFFGSPYTVIATTILLSLGINAENFLEAVLITGFGAATAKSVMYALGYGVGSKLKSNRSVQFFHRVMRGRSL